MENQVKEKIEAKKRVAGAPVTMYLEDIPGDVHKKLQKYRTKIIGRYGVNYTIKQAYVEFLKDKTKSIK
jgi:hypothetical protein